MLRHLLLPALVVVTGCATPGHEPSSYVTLAAGTSPEAFKNITLSADDSLTGHVRLGHRPNRYFAADLEFSMAEEWEFDRSDSGFRAVSGGANVKFFAPWTGLQPYILGGAGIVQVSDVDVPGGQFDETDAYVKGGLGAEWNLTESIFLLGEATYTLPLQELDDLRYYMFVGGIGIRF